MGDNSTVYSSRSLMVVVSRHGIPDYLPDTGTDRNMGDTFAQNRLQLCVCRDSI
jgi:hypothetical protein